MSLLLALLASLLWGTSDFLGGTASRRLRVLAVVGLSQAAALVVLLPVALALGALRGPHDYLLPAVSAGLVGAVALGSFYAALARGTMGVVAPIAALGVVVPVAVGLLRGEQPGGLQVVGIVVAVAGVVLASGPELRAPGGAVPLLLASVAAVGFGTVLVLLAEASDGGGVRTVVLTLTTMRLASVSVLVGALLGGRLLGIAPRAGARPGWVHLRVLVVVGVFDAGANGAFAVASQADLVSVTSVLASLYPAVTVLLAYRVHAELLGRVQLVGVSAALVGVVLLAAG